MGDLTVHLGGAYPEVILPPDLTAEAWYYGEPEPETRLCQAAAMPLDRSAEGHGLSSAVIDPSVRDPWLLLWPASRQSWESAYWSS